jgi:hypothetical protein
MRWFYVIFDEFKDEFKSARGCSNLLAVFCDAANDGESSKRNQLRWCDGWAHSVRTATFQRVFERAARGSPCQTVLILTIDRLRIAPPWTGDRHEGSVSF